MTSGIYKLTFTSGDTYIGKSINVENRYKQHLQSFVLGEAATKMQLAYSKFGTPVSECLATIHPDHIDLFEAAFILNHKPSLNTTIPEDALFVKTSEQLQVLADKSNISTLDHINTIISLESMLNKTKTTLSKLERETEDNVNRYKKLLKENTCLKDDVHKLSNNALIQRCAILEECIDNLIKEAEVKDKTYKTYYNLPWWKKILK